MRASKTVFCAVSLTLLSIARAALSQEPPIVAIDGGAIQGMLTSGVAVFKGIPYAAPPVGDLRWRSPQPVPAWDGTLTTTEFGPQCYQKQFPQFGLALAPISEDCLTLNVFAPAEMDAKHPVMVWIHGGGFQLGASSLPFYESTAFAEDGVVLVTVNYRLDRFGFFAHPELAEEAGEAPTANYGIMDIMAALEWVKRNIAAFGGDAGNVTIFGVSAGGSAVNMLMVAPQADGLFHKAIVQSGGGRPGPQPPEDDEIGLGYETRRDIAWAAAAGAPDLKSLRALPSDQILSGGADFADGNRPMIDGLLLPDAPHRIFGEGGQAQVPYMIGASGYEASFLPPQEVGEIWAQASAADARLATVYDGYGTGDEAMIAAQFVGDRVMVEPARMMARHEARNGRTTWLYHFSYVNAAMSGKIPAAGHAHDQSYIFGTIDTRIDNTAPADRAMSDMIHAYWVNFAKTGNPNGAGLPEWPSYDAASDALLEFANDGLFVRKNFAKARLDLLTEIAESQEGAGD